MIYGANGYTGKLIAQEAKRRGMNPVLAGRSKEALLSLGKELGLETSIFNLDHPQKIAQALREIDLVLHCAGPFALTSKLMMEGCLQSKTHYFDITGEIWVFEGIFSRNADCLKAGITAIPGVGFDVVATDCVAALLKQKLPDANHLTLALKSSGKISRGTTKTAVGISSKGLVRRNGKIVKTSNKFETRYIAFGHRKTLAMRIPWGDISTAFHSTHIPNIEVFIATKKWVPFALALTGVLTRFTPFKRLIQAIIGKVMTGPSREERKKATITIWGEVKNPAGQTAQLVMQTPDGYDFTVDAALACVNELFKGSVPSGALTPSRAFGVDFALRLKNVKLLT